MRNNIYMNPNYTVIVFLDLVLLMIWNHNFKGCLVCRVRNENEYFVFILFFYILFIFCEWKMNWMILFLVFGLTWNSKLEWLFIFILIFGKNRNVNEKKLTIIPIRVIWNKFFYFHLKKIWGFFFSLNNKIKKK